MSWRDMDQGQPSAASRWKKPPAISARLALSICSHAWVVFRLVTSWSRSAAQNDLFPFPEPCLTNLWEINPLLVVREDARKLASAASIPAKHPSTNTITHPPNSQFLRCPGRPMTQCYSFFGKAWAAEYDIANRTCLARQRCMLGSKQFRACRRGARKNKLATCPGSTFYFAPRDLPLVFFGPCGEQSPTSTLASSKCHLRTALPFPCTCTTPRCHHCGTYQPRPPFTCPVLRSAASSVPLLV